MAPEMRVQVYQQFDADPTREVPGEGYGGWGDAEIPNAPEKTALVLMHAWDTGAPGQFPGWERAVEYIPRANAICRDVLPTLLADLRESGWHVIHVVGGGDYYKALPGYTETLALAGPKPDGPPPLPRDEHTGALHALRRERAFVGPHNEADVAAGFARLDFPEAARPHPGEPICEDDRQLDAVCRARGVRHLVYAGFAINWCLLMSPGGMLDMSRRGYVCSAVRDAVTAVENKESARTQSHKEEALWRTALAFGFVVDSADLRSAALQNPRR